MDATSGEFDRELYDEARDLMGDKFQALLDKYFSTTKERLETIERALPKKEAETMAGLAHNIKSTSASFGFLAVADAARAMEDMCRKMSPPDMSEVHGVLLRLKENLKRIEVLLESGRLV